MFKFEIIQSDPDSRARTGIISTSHGTIRTPCFVPVATQAALKGLTAQHASEVGSDILMVNTYHTYLRPGANIIANHGGLHQFMGWKGPIMTDSGGFQVFSLARPREGKSFVSISNDKVIFRSHIDASLHDFSPEKSILIQEALGADIIFAFDECTPFEASREVTQAALARTHAWLDKCIAVRTRKDQALFGIVQGGKFEDLRLESAQFISSRDVQGFGIGSIFGNPKKETQQVLKTTMNLLPRDKPVHLLGIGAAEDILMGVTNGVDTFDCVLPTRLGRQGYIYSTECALSTKFRYRITNANFREDQSPLDKSCSCWVCKNYTRSYVHHLFRANESLGGTLVSYHNIAYFNNLMTVIRNSITSGTLEELQQKILSGSANRKGIFQVNRNEFENPKV